MSQDVQEIRNYHIDNIREAAKDKDWKRTLLNAEALNDEYQAVLKILDVYRSVELTK